MLAFRKLFEFSEDNKSQFTSFLHSKLEFIFICISICIVFMYLFIELVR